MKVQVQVKDQLLKAYLPQLTKQSEGNIHIVTRENDFGKYLISLVKTRYSKVPFHESADHITFRLPKCDALDAAESKFIYIPIEDQVKVCDRILVEFHTDFDRYYLAGKRMDKFTDKQIIEAFIVERGLSELLSDNERLKKRMYRQSMKDLKSMVKWLVRKARYRNLEISANVQAQLIHSKSA